MTEVNLLTNKQTQAWYFLVRARILLTERRKHAGEGEPRAPGLPVWLLTGPGLLLYMSRLGDDSGDRQIPSHHTRFEA